MTMRTALKTSSNRAAVRMLEDLGYSARPLTTPSGLALVRCPVCHHSRWEQARSRSSR